MFKIGGDEVWMNQVRGTIPIKMTFHNCLEFIETFTTSIPFNFRADHWELFDLWGVSIHIRVLKSIVSSNVSSRMAICWGEWEGVLVKMA